MVAVCVFFQVHRPMRLRKDYNFFNIGQDHGYEDKEGNRADMRRYAETCCEPANALMADLIKEHRGGFHAAFLVSGTTLDRLEEVRPECVDSFKALARTGCVEFVGGTYYHSLAFMHSKTEFLAQVERHRERMENAFGRRPVTFCNTELIYNNDLARVVDELGYATVLAEGADHVVAWRTPNFVYRPETCRKLKVLTRNYRLSEELAGWGMGPRNKSDVSAAAARIAQVVRDVAGRGDVLNLFMDYSVFSRGRDDGATLDIFRETVRRVLEHAEFRFVTPSEASAKFGAVARLDVPHYVSWSDVGRNTSAWVGSALQDAALEYVYKLEKRVQETGDGALLDAWRMLQAAEHFRHMCTKPCVEQGTPNPYDSPYLAHIVYMNVLNDLHERIKRSSDKPRRKPKSPRKVHPTPK